MLNRKSNQPECGLEGTVPSLCPGVEALLELVLKMSQNLTLSDTVLMRKRHSPARKPMAQVEKDRLQYIL